MNGLPTSSVELVVIAAMLRALESRLPGFTNEVQTLLEDEALQAEVIRLRSPKPAPEVKQNFMLAVAWVNAVRLVTRAVAIKPKGWLRRG